MTEAGSETREKKKRYSPQLGIRVGWCLLHRASFILLFVRLFLMLHLSSCGALLLGCRLVHNSKHIGGRYCKESFLIHCLTHPWCCAERSAPAPWGSPSPASGPRWSAASMMALNIHDYYKLSNIGYITHPERWLDISLDDGFGGLPSPGSSPCWAVWPSGLPFRALVLIASEIWHLR